MKKLYETAHRFVDNVSHEFRTPLTVIKDYVSLVREGMVGDVNDEQKQMLDVAGVRADELNNMVDDMLDVSKLESGLLGTWRRKCAFEEIVNSVCPPLTKRANVKNIEFRIELDDDLPEIYCDSEKIGRVIINLVTNAMKFCSDPGVVRLWARPDFESGTMTVGVTDNGPGIDPEGVAKIFQRFKQLKTQLKSSTKGFGLGLNIAKELVDLNFGEMSVESRVGKGSTFFFSVPLNDPVEVMRRYLDRLKISRDQERTVALVGAQIAAAETQSGADDADAFFNFLLRRNDLLFRGPDGMWIFVLPIADVELDKFTARAEHEWEKANRNRPFGPIPEFNLHHLGTWKARKGSEEILQYFSQAIQGRFSYRETLTNTTGTQVRLESHNVERTRQPGTTPQSEFSRPIDVVFEDTP